MFKPLKQHQTVKSPVGNGIVTLIHFAVSGQPAKYTVKLKNGDEREFWRSDLERM